MRLRATYHRTQGVRHISPHKHPEVRDWTQTNDVELVFLPTYASWLNWIEAHFAALRYFALNDTDHQSHEQQDAAIGDYVRWYNRRARPKTAFAINSKIRDPSRHIATYGWSDR